MFNRVIVTLIQLINLLLRAIKLDQTARETERFNYISAHYGKRKQLYVNSRRIKSARHVSRRGPGVQASPAGNSRRRLHAAPRVGYLGAVHVQRHVGSSSRLRWLADCRLRRTESHITDDRHPGALPEHQVRERRSRARQHRSRPRALPEDQQGSRCVREARRTRRRQQRRERHESGDSRDRRGE